MKKIIAFVLLSSFALCVFCGCSEFTQALDAELEAKKEELQVEQAAIDAMTGKHLEKVAIDADTGFIYYRDVITDVMYSVYVDTYKAGYAGGMGCGLTVMYHPDGSPLLYSEWLGYEATPDHVIGVTGGGKV